MQNIGVNTHAQIDAHISNTSNPHQTTISNLTDTNISLLNNLDLLQYDNVSGKWLNKDFTTVQTGIDHNNLQNIGVNTHAQIDSHISSNIAHGTTSNIVGISDTQTLTNKSFGNNLDMGTNNIINLGAPINDNDATTKYYVDNLVSGLSIKEATQVGTTQDLNNESGITSGTISYNNGTSGFGATITATLTISGSLTIDGYSLNVGDRILIKDGATNINGLNKDILNGIYDVTSMGTTIILTRSSDYDNTPNNEVRGGVFNFIENGTINADTGWVIITNGLITLGTTPILYSQFSGAGNITAGPGLIKSGNELSIKGLTTAAPNQILTVNGTSSGITYTNDINVNNLYNNGYRVVEIVGTTGITGSYIQISNTATFNQITSFGNGLVIQPTGGNPIDLFTCNFTGCNINDNIKYSNTGTGKYALLQYSGTVNNPTLLLPDISGTQILATENYVQTFKDYFKAYRPAFRDITLTTYEKIDLYSIANTANKNYVSTISYNAANQGIIITPYGNNRLLIKLRANINIHFYSSDGIFWRLSYAFTNTPTITTILDEFEMYSQGGQFVSQSYTIRSDTPIIFYLEMKLRGVSSLTRVTKMTSLEFDISLTDLVI